MYQEPAAPSSRRLPPLNALRAFEAAARLGSFSAAARELNVTHGAVSHQIKALEAWLGTPLFERRARAVHLTPAGDAYRPAIEGALSQIHAATADLIQSLADRPLHVTATPAFAVRWLAPRLGRLWRDHPDLDLRLHEEPWTANVEPGSGIADLVIRVGDVRGPGLESIRLMAGTVTPMCSPRLLEEGPPVTRPRDLLAYSLLHSHSYAPWEDWFAHHDVVGGDIAHGPVFDDTNLAYSAALAGQGIGLLHTALTVEETAAGQLVRLFEGGPWDDLGYYLVYRKASSNDPRVTRMRDWLLSMADT